MLGYAAKRLTQKATIVEDSDVEDLRATGWDEQGTYEATALISLLFQWSDGGRFGAAGGIGYQKKRGSPRQLPVSLLCGAGSRLGGFKGYTQFGGSEPKTARRC
jgi:hypothetical protein